MIADAARIRLLQFIGSFAIGGQERQVMNLAKGLDRARIDLHFGCLRHVGEYLAEFEALRIPVTDYNITRLYGLHTLGQQVRFASYLRRNRIDIVHSNDLYVNCFAIPAAWLARTPVIVASIGGPEALLTPLRRRVQRTICGLADVVLVNAEALRQHLLAEGYSPDKLVVIRNGIDLARFERRRTGGGVRQELGMPGDAPLVAMFARVNRLKGVEYFIEAAAAVSAGFPDVRFLVVGDALVVKDGVIAPNSDYRSELKEQIRRLGLEGRVVFTGFRLDVPDLLSEVTVSVLPSLSEGLPNAVLESMAAAVPVVATRIGGTPEVIEDGVTGLLVPPRDSAALARAIRRILEDRELGARLGQAGRRQVAERFSLEHMVREMERLYATLLGRVRRASPRGFLPDPGLARTSTGASPRR